MIGLTVVADVFFTYSVYGFSSLGVGPILGNRDGILRQNYAALRQGIEMKENLFSRIFY